MKKILGAIVFLLILAVCVVLYLRLSGEQADKTLSQKEPVSQTDTQVEEPVAENPQTVSSEKTTLPPSHQSDAEQLRQEAEQRFEKLTRIEAESGKPVERGEGLRIRIEVPTPTEPAQVE